MWNSADTVSVELLSDAIARSHEKPNLASSRRNEVFARKSGSESRSESPTSQSKVSPTVTSLLDSFLLSCILRLQPDDAALEEVAAQVPRAYVSLKM